VTSLLSRYVVIDQHLIAAGCAALAGEQGCHTVRTAPSASSQRRLRLPRTLPSLQAGRGVRQKMAGIIVGLVPRPEATHDDSAARRRVSYVSLGEVQPTDTDVT